MLFTELKKGLCLILALAFFSTTTFATTSNLSIGQSVNLYNYQIDSEIISSEEATDALEANIKLLLANGASPEAIQKEIVGVLPTDLQREFNAQLEALKAQGASADEIADLTYAIAAENQVTGVAFSGGPAVGNSSFAIIVGIIIVVVIAYYIDQEDDDDIQEEEEPNDCYGHGGYGGGYGYSVMSYGNDYCSPW